MRHNTIKLLLVVLVGFVMISMKLSASNSVLKTDVLIIGAGPVGSFASNELSSLKVSHIIIDKRSQILDTHPRAQSINARSMEFFLKHGFSEALRREAYLNNDYFPGVMLCKNFASFDATPFLLDSLSVKSSNISPEKELRVAQWKTDRILREEIAKSTFANMMLDYEATEIKDYESFILTTINNKKTGEKKTIQSKYLIGADGAHSSVRKMVGIEVTQKDIEVPLLNVNFTSSNLNEKIPFQKAYLYYLSGSPTPLATGPVDNQNSWYAQVVYPDKLNYTKEEAAALLKEYFKIDFDCHVEKAYVWKMRANIANQYRKNHIFLIGDAAHSMYATGGLGMNTGFGDAQNLAWKIAAHLKGIGTNELLNSYEIERKPIALENMRAASINLRNALSRSDSPLIEKFSDMNSEGMAKHASNPERELGYFYDHSKVMPYVSETGYLKEGPFKPKANPGYFAPHIWLEDSLSLYHVLGSQYTLIVPQGAKEGVQAKRIAQKLKIPFQVLEVEINKLADLYEPYTLIRPDWHIVWTGNTFSNDFEEILKASLGQKSTFE